MKELAFGLKIHFISKIDEDDGNVCENVHGFEKTIKESDILAESKKIGKLLLKKELGRVPPGAPGGNAVRARNESSQEKDAASKQDNRVDGGKRKYMRDSAQSVMKKCKLTSFTNQPLFFQHTLFHDSLKTHQFTDKLVNNCLLQTYRRDKNSRLPELKVQITLAVFKILTEFNNKINCFSNNSLFKQINSSGTEVK